METNKRVCNTSIVSLKEELERNRRSHFVLFYDTFAF